MKKFKFKRGSVVYLSYSKLLDRSEDRKFIIHSRKKDNDENLYELIEVLCTVDNWKTTILWKIWRMYKDTIWYLVLKNPYYYGKIISHTSFYMGFDKFKTPILSEDVFDVGLRNFPRMDNLLQEDRIEKHLQIYPKICSEGGCELIGSFLDSE